jgi:uncharacterized protein YkwD
MLLQTPFKVVLAITWLVLTAPARADLLDSLNQLRFKDCAPPAEKPPVLRRSSGLDAVAREWSNGGRLGDAIQHTTYHTKKLASMQVQGTTQDASIAATLREKYCGILTDARYSEVGLFRRDQGVWIVVATPSEFPSANDERGIQHHLLELVNQARSQPRMCGTTEFKAAAPVRESAVLSNAASGHAQDMAQHQFFQHQGSDGSSPGVRATRAGYIWSSVGENIAAGIMSPEELMEGWLASPGHCANIMQPRYTEMGLAYAVSEQSRAGIYWSQVFARPHQ